MKRRLHQPALLHVHRILARQQALAEQPFGSLQPPAFDEEAVVGDEDVADVLRRIHEHDVFAAHPI